MTERTGRPTPRLRGGALMVLAVCFVASALIRAGDVVAALPERRQDGPVQQAAPAAAEPSAAAAPPGPEREGADALVSALKRQRETLDAREAALDERENTLKALEKRLERRLEDVRQARERLSKTAALVTDAAAKDVERLAQMYQQMKPKQAGQIFNEMAPSFAAGFIAAMRPDAAALVLANMDADKAYAISLLLAGRNVRDDSGNTDAVD